MSKEEMICKNCKYHYIEEISFDYPQSCCDKRKAVIEEWFNCNDFEYSDKYIEQLQQENKKLNGAIQTYNILLKSNVEENKQLKDNWNKLKENLLEINFIEFEKSFGKRYGKAFTQAEINICNMILNKMEEIEQGSDDNNGTN